MLSDRRQRVLAALIEEYVARALPVGSRTLTERYRLGVSPATVRNELSALEDEGYLSQPHTSAGRIPTDFGYRSFVDDLIRSGAIEEDEGTRASIAQLRNSARELDDLLEKTSTALAQLTDCLSIVLAPSMLSRDIKQITLISLTEYSAIIVIVTIEGDVFNRRIEFNESVSPDELARAQRILNGAFSGHTLDNSVEYTALANELKSSDPLVSIILDEIIQCINENSPAHAHRLGMSALMRKPEFRQTESLLPIVQVLEDDTVLLELLNAAQDEDGTPTVRIGAENSTKALSGVSVVASRYGRKDAEGFVAVIGPTRMDYTKVLKAVRMASVVLGDD